MAPIYQCCIYNMHQTQTYNVSVNQSSNLLEETIHRYTQGRSVCIMGKLVYNPAIPTSTMQDQFHKAVTRSKVVADQSHAANVKMSAIVVKSSLELAHKSTSLHHECPDAANWSRKDVYCRTALCSSVETGNVHQPFLFVSAAALHCTALPQTSPLHCQWKAVHAPPSPCQAPERRKQYIQIPGHMQDQQ